jgi:hypothetical protein
VLSDGRAIEAVIELKRPKPKDFGIPLRGARNPDGTGVEIPKEALEQFDKKNLEFDAVWIMERAKDIVGAIPILEMMNRGERDARFKGRIDLGKLGVFGHSLGGKDAAAACQIEPRIKAGLNIDGLTRSRPIVPIDGRDTVDQPFMHIGKPFQPFGDEYLGETGMTREQADQELIKWNATLEIPLRKVKSGAYLVMVPGVTHGDFGDDPYLINKPESIARGNIAVPAARAYVRAFFEETLLGRTSPLLKEPSPEFPGVTVKRFGPGSSE